MKVSENILNIIFINLTWLCFGYFVVGGHWLFIVIVLLFVNPIFIIPYKVHTTLENKKHAIIRRFFSFSFFLHGLSVLLMTIWWELGWRQGEAWEYLLILLFSMFISVAYFVVMSLSLLSVAIFKKRKHTHKSISSLMQPIIGIIMAIFSIILFTVSALMIIAYCYALYLQLGG